MKRFRNAPLATAAVALLTLLLLGRNVQAAAAQKDTDLSVVKVAHTATARVGDNVPYTITLTNNGPAKARGVLLGEGAPDELGVISFDCGKGTPVSQGAFTCRYDKLAKGETVTITFVATVTPDAMPGEEVTNRAEAYFEACPDRFCGDPDYSNNVGTATITIVE